MSIFSRMRKIEEHMESIPDGTQHIQFEDKTVVKIDINKMFDSLLAGKANKAALYMLNELEKGNPDIGGLVYLVETYNDMNDPEKMAELWKDEIEEMEKGEVQE